MIIRDNFCQLCIKTSVVSPHLNRLNETVQMRGHNMVSERNKKNNCSIIVKYFSYLELWSALSANSVDTDQTDPEDAEK